MIVRLPYPISANRYWRQVRLPSRTAILVSEDAREYKARVAEIAAAAECVPWEVDVEMWLTLHPKLTLDGLASKTRMDLDNCVKIALDCCQGALYLNDRQVVSLHAAIGEAVDGGGLTVRAEPARRA